MSRHHSGDDRDLPPAGAEGEVLVGVVEDDRVRAVVTAQPDEVHVVLEGDLEGSVTWIIDDLLAAVTRWGRGVTRSGGGTFTGADEADRAPDLATSPARGGGRLLLDASRIGSADESAWQMLAANQRRWTHERGPCVVRHPRRQVASSR